MADLAGKWKDLGLSLGIRSCDLDAIITAGANSPSDSLREMLILWLKQSYNVCTTLILMVLEKWVSVTNYINGLYLQLNNCSCHVFRVILTCMAILLMLFNSRMQCMSNI